MFEDSILNTDYCNIIKFIRVGLQAGHENALQVNNPKKCVIKCSFKLQTASLLSEIPPQLKARKGPFCIRNCLPVNTV